MAGDASRKNGKLGGKPVASATLQAQIFRAALAERITKNAGAWMDAIEKMALGNGETKPDPNAWSKGMDRAFGKPQEHVDHTTGGEPLEEKLSVKQLALMAEFEKKMKESITE